MLHKSHDKSPSWLLIMNIANNRLSGPRPIPDCIGSLPTFEFFNLLVNRPGA
uniref:Uncharacterized protein n=1 Tax=Arundo donax TaxID=35708 RepID=A0A0A8YWW3_ARUDO